jgi:uncharacterized protein YdeI (YjbR/CyaY-like superfamily)
MTGKKPSFFRNSDEFRKWLEANHASEKELVVGFCKKASGEPSITYPEARDQALCFGWIDGVRNALDKSRYAIRFTPRKAKSIWSNVNIARVEAMLKDGLMKPAGMKAFEARLEKRSGIYAFENKQQGLSPEFEKRFRANKKAWAFFQSLAPWYQRTAIFRVMSAKREETREKRLAELIRDSAAGLTIKELRRKH